MSCARTDQSASSSSRRARVEVVSDEIEVIDLVDIEDLEDVKVGDEGFFEVLNGLLSREARRGLPIELQELSDKNASNGEKVINHLLKKKFSPLVDELRNMSAAELETYILVEQNRLDIATKAENDELRQQLDKIGNEALRDGLFSKYKKVITYWKGRFPNLKTNRGPSGKHLFRVVNGLLQPVWEWRSRSWPRTLFKIGPCNVQYVDILIIEFLEKVEPWVRKSIIDAAEHNQPAPDFNVFFNPANKTTSALDSEDQGIYVLMWTLINEWKFSYCGSTTTSFEQRMVGHIGRPPSAYAIETTKRFVAKKAPRESKTAWFKNNCDAIVLVPQSKDVSKDTFHGQETLAMLLWRFNEEVMCPGVAGANLNGVDSLTTKAKLKATSLIAFLLLVQKTIEAGEFTYARADTSQRNEWLQKKIVQLKLNVTFDTLDQSLSGITRTRALGIIHDKKAGKHLRNPWDERKQGGIAAMTGAWIRASVPTTKPIPGERSPKKYKPKNRTPTNSSAAGPSSKNKKENKGKGKQVATGSKRRVEDYDDSQDDDNEASQPNKRFRHGES